jgi:serine/threonine protein kinase
LQAESSQRRDDQRHLGTERCLLHGDGERAGTTLQRANIGSGLPLKDATKYGVEIADALAAARAGGIIFLDLKPANIMINEDRRTKLVDFGLEKLAQPAGASAGRST